MIGCRDLVAVLLHEGNAEESARTVPIASGRVLDGPPRRSTDTSRGLPLCEVEGLGKQQDDQDNP